MVIFVFGEDGYRVDLKVRQLAEHFKQKFDKGGMNVDRFDARDTDVASARDVIVSPPFLAEKRFVVVRGFSAWAQDEVFHALVQNVPLSTVAVFVDEMSAKEYAALKLQKTLLDWHEYPFPALAPNELTDFAIEEAKRRRVVLAAPVAQELISRLPADSWSVATEVEKLCAGANGAITRELVLQHLPDRPDDRIFDLVDAIGSGSRSAALGLLEHQLAFGSHPLQLLTMIERQIRLLLSAQSAFEGGMRTSDALASALSVHSFVGKKLLAAAQRPNPRLASLLVRIAELDSKMKTGQIAPEVGITLLLAQ